MENDNKMNVCRVCFSDKDLTNLFTEKSDNLSINFLAFVKIHQNDGRSQLICPQCVKYLTTCLDFINKCSESHQKLNVQNYKCLKCDAIFPCYESLTMHYNRLHTPNKLIERKLTQQCHICGKTFTFRVELSRHLDSHLGLRSYKCDKCNKSYISKTSLKKHVIKHDRVKRFHCILCPKRFFHQDNLRTHCKTHNSERKHQCCICTKKFKCNRSLAMHLKIHANERNFPCNECEKAFVNKYDLLRHLKLHEKKRLIENKTYDLTKDELLKVKNLQQCEKCGKFCPSHGDLKKHQRVHTDERPFSCKDCNKAFKTVSTLRCHERIHTKIKPYVCKYCSKAFSQSSNMRTHERLHSGMRPHDCKHCCKTFVRKRDLDNHLRKHT